MLTPIPQLITAIDSHDSRVACQYELTNSTQYLLGKTTITKLNAALCLTSSVNVFYLTRHHVIASNRVLGFYFVKTQNSGVPVCLPVRLSRLRPCALLQKPAGWGHLTIQQRDFLQPDHFPRRFFHSSQYYSFSFFFIFSGQLRYLSWNSNANTSHSNYFAKNRKPQ